MENPDHPEFTNLTEEKRTAITEAARHPMWLQPRVWHWNVQNRPHERDLLKAEIFMEETIEDLH